MDIFKKILTWLKMVSAGLIGCVQAILKGVKEALTSLVDVLSLVIPTEKAQEIVETIREKMNEIDSFFEVIKAKLLKKIA